MNALQYLMKFLKTLPDMAHQTGRSTVGLAVSYGMNYIFRGANSEEFRALHLYDMNWARRNEYLLMRECVRRSDRLNAGATKEELDTFDDKHLFNDVFRNFVHRDWIYIPASTDDEIRAFIARNEQFMTKLCVSTQGKGVTKHISKVLDVDVFLSEYRGLPYLMEAFICQHPAMAEANPSTVNTLRVQTARIGERVMILGACMRAGGAAAHVDNFHQGGIAYPVDVETGIICGRGQTLLGDDIYIRHPSTGKIMPGFTVPYWERLKEEVKRAAVTVPHIGYVGWDIAVTEAGPEFVEGNINYPDPIVVELNGNAFRRKLKEFMAQHR